MLGNNLSPAAAQVELGFEETDYAVREGRTGSFFLRTYVGTLSSDITIRLIPLTVTDFNNYRTNNPTRMFAQTILDDIDDISDHAECKHKINVLVYQALFHFPTNSFQMSRCQMVEETSTTLLSP